MLNENVVWAKSILLKNSIDKDSEEWDDYLKIREICGNNNAYVGILTKLRFIDKVDDMEEISSIFDVLKDSKIDITKLNKLSYDEILEMFYDELSPKDDKNGYELIYKDSEYSYYRVYTYEGGLKIDSPAWCLKTKSHWDAYNRKYGENWVVICNRYKNKLLTPDTNYLSEYKNNSKPWVRYGISLKDDNGDIDWIGFNDNNYEQKLDPNSYTFYGIFYTVLNLIRDRNKSTTKMVDRLSNIGSYYDIFPYTKKCFNFLEIINPDKFFKWSEFGSKVFDRIKVIDPKKEYKYYVLFSRSYSFYPVILCLPINIVKTPFWITPDKYGGNPIEVGKMSSELISDFISKLESENILYAGIEIKNGTKNIEHFKEHDNYFGVSGDYLIFNNSKGDPDDFLVININCKEIKFITINTLKNNIDIETPYCFRYNLKTEKISWCKKNALVDEVITYIKNESERLKPVEPETTEEPEEKKEPERYVEPEEKGTSDQEPKNLIKRFKDWFK